MLICIGIRFTGGAYHATAWGRHVNEGAVDWPPAPWRIIRALIACWHRKHPDLAEQSVKDVLNALAGEAPVYWLPPAIAVHTRHYMPLYRTDKGSSAKVYDAFLRIETTSEMLICWPNMELESTAWKTMATLLDSLSYLGRAESWICARLVAEIPPETCWNSEPVQDELQLSRAQEVERVLLPEKPDTYLQWRAEAMEALTRSDAESALEAKRDKAAASDKDAAAVTLTKKQIEKIQGRVQSMLPPDLIAALHVETSDLQHSGWSAPPGSRWIRYSRPVLDTSPSVQLHRPPAGVSGRAVARFALTADTAGADTRPRLHEAVHVADRFRRSLMSQSRRLAEEGGVAEANADQFFSGKDSEGQPLQDHHRHAYVLPGDDDQDGRIDTITVYSREGFHPDHLSTMARLRKIWQHGGRPGLWVSYLGESRLDLGHGRLPDWRRRICGVGTSWESVTPFVLTRHPKRHKDGRPKLDVDGIWIDGPEQQVLRELALHGYPAPKRVEIVDHGPRWRRFVRDRPGGGSRAAGGTGFGIYVEFLEPVAGPLALGYGCHFGLGQFTSIESRNPVAAAEP